MWARSGLLLHAEKVAVRALVGLSRVTARVVPRSSYVGKMDMYMHLGIGLTRLDALAAFLRSYERLVRSGTRCYNALKKNRTGGYRSPLTRHYYR